MLTLTILGGCREEGRASFLLRADGRSWLLDCGVKRLIAADHVGEYPALDLLDPASLEAVILSHAHEDHSAALPLLYKRGFSGKVYCTPPTAELAVQYCRTWQTTVERYGISAPYSADDVARIRFSMHPYGEKIDLGLKVTFSPAGHLVGSAVCRLEWQGHHFVYTGDAAFASRLLEDPCTEAAGEAMILDGSCGVHTLPRAAAEEQLLSLIRGAVAEDGSVLLPLPHFGRSQDVLLLLHKYSTGLPPVFVEANIRDACSNYFRFEKWLRPGAVAHLRTALASTSYRFIETEAQRRDAMRTTPSIILATDAMLSNGPVIDYLYALAGSPRNLVVLTGYQAPGTLGRRLSEGAFEIETPRGPIGMRARIEMATLKAHPDYNEILRLIGANTPKVFIAHSEGHAADNLEQALQSRGLAAIAPALESTHTLID